MTSDDDAQVSNALAYCQRAARLPDRRQPGRRASRRFRPTSARSRRSASTARSTTRASPGRGAPRRRLETAEPARLRRRRRRDGADRLLARDLEGAGGPRGRDRRHQRADPTTPSDDVSGQLNPQGVNVLRSFPAAGTVVWGARTLQGRRLASSEFKYVPVRRLTDYIASSLYLGTQFAVFEANDHDAVVAATAGGRSVHARPVPPGRLPAEREARRVGQLLRRSATTPSTRSPRSTSAASTSWSASRR